MKDKSNAVLPATGCSAHYLIQIQTGFCYHTSVTRPNHIQLHDGKTISILYEDASVLAIDKPRGWMLDPVSWRQPGRNLQAALNSSIAAGDFWARSRNLNYLRFVHPLDAETTGILLLARNPGAVAGYSRLFEGRIVEKVYLAVVHGEPEQQEWNCRFKLAPDAREPGKMRVDTRGNEAETVFRVLQLQPHVTLIEARLFTGRTHQIRVHLARSSHTVLGDELYGAFSTAKPATTLALRAVRLAYTDPFTRQQVVIRAPADEFCREYGFDAPAFS
jgi:RluA family pseudouridine synthase